MDRLLEKQRLMYEARLNKLQRERQQNVSAAPTTTHGKTTGGSSSNQAAASTSHHGPSRSNQPWLHSNLFTHQPANPSHQEPRSSAFRSNKPWLQLIPSMTTKHEFLETQVPPLPGRNRSRGSLSTSALIGAKYRNAMSVSGLDLSGRLSTRNITSSGSDSSSPTGNTTDDDEEFNCRTCKKKYGVVIYQCGRGHSSCKDCKLKAARCGVCDELLTCTRNITLEGYIAERQTACPNATDGCRLIFKTSEMEAHVKKCPFSEIACPLAAMFGGCDWKGKISQMASHFDDVHPEHRQGAVDTEMLIPNIATDSTTVHLIQMGPYNFLIYAKVDEKTSNVYMTVQHLGTSVSAAKWTYEIQIYTKNFTPKLKYTDICHTNSNSVEDIFKEAKCLTIPLWYAMNFVDCGCLAYKFHLKKDFGRKGRRRE